MLNNQLGLVTFDDRAIHLEPLAFDLLSILMARSRQLVLRHDLLRYLGRDESQGYTSGGQVLNNTVAALRKRLIAEIGADGGSLIKTGRGGYYFDGDVTAEALAGAEGSYARLNPGDHMATARAILVNRIGTNSGIEEWIGHRSDDVEQFCRIRIATTSNGARRLKHEKQVYDYLDGCELTKDSIVQPRSNLKMPIHQSLTWDLPPHSLNYLDKTNGFLGELSAKHRLSLAKQIVSVVTKLNKAGVVHGDLKLANIYVVEAVADGRNGTKEVRLSGFAHAFVEPAMGGSSNGWGTQNRSWRNRRSDSLAYCAPELLDQSPTTVQSDIYALGIILFKICAGSSALPFEANWQDEIACPVLREDIAACTARTPSKRLSSASELSERLDRYQSRIEAEERQIEILAKAERAKKRRPVLLSALAILAVLAASFGILSISQKAANERIRAEANEAAMARDALRSILLSADPRSTAGSSGESVEQLLERASQTASNATTDPSELATLHLILAEAYRGRGDVRSELKHLRAAIPSLADLGELERLATTRYALANSLLIAGGSSSAGNQREALSQVALANSDFDKFSEPSADLRAARSYAEGMIKSQGGDFEDALNGLEPWLAIVRANDVSLDRRKYNAVVLVGQAQLRTGDAKTAFETLEWLRSKETDEIAPYIRINRKSMQALVSSALGRSDTGERFERLLVSITSIYGEGSIPEASARNYYGIHLESIGRLEDAASNQKISKSIFCERLPTALYCEGPRVNLASILIKQGRYDEASRHLSVVESVFAKDFPAGLAQITFLRGLIAVGGDDWPEASSLFQSITPEEIEAASPTGKWPALLSAMRRISANPDTPSTVDDAIRSLSAQRVDKSTIDWLKGTTAGV